MCDNHFFSHPNKMKVFFIYIQCLNFLKYDYFIAVAAKLAKCPFLCHKHWCFFFRSFFLIYFSDCGR